MLPILNYNGTAWGLAVWEKVIGALRDICLPCADQTEAILRGIREFNPSQSTVLWFQLIVALLTIIWIVYQFAWLRRLNEARLEKYLEDKILIHHDELVRDRIEILAEFDRVARQQGIARWFLRFWANLLLIIDFFMRVLRLGKIKDPVEFALLLAKVGKLNEARACLQEAALDAVRLLRIWDSGLENKKFETQSALVFAGRVAVLQGRQVAAASAFQRANLIRPDPDARILIGRQLADGGDVEGALAQFAAALDPLVRPAQSVEVPAPTRAEAHRRIAEVRVRQRSPKRALAQLRQAKRLESPLNRYVGMALTDEMAGDIYQSQDFRNAARRAYTDAKANFQLAKDPSSTARLTRKLRSLDGTKDVKDGHIARILHQLAQALAMLVEKLRDRARKKAARK